MTILEENAQRKKELLDQIERTFFSEDRNGRSIASSTVKKIATYENLLRFYQNSLHTFALESHYHYAQDIKTDPENRFVTDKQIEAINRFGNTAIATTEQIESLFA